MPAEWVHSSVDNQRTDSPHSNAAESAILSTVLHLTAPSLQRKHSEACCTSIRPMGLLVTPQREELGQVFLFLYEILNYSRPTKGVRF